MFFVAKHLAKELGIEEWYKLHINVWEKWGQEVMHLHMHLMSKL
jgi:diadenosine tetraphosphate (Ap4A) HIT family hydrolase